MTPNLPRPDPNAPLTWVGLAVGLAGLAAAMSPFPAPAGLLWAVASLAVASLATAGAVDASSRLLVEAPTAAQLHIVRELFRDAAVALEQARRVAA